MGNVDKTNELINDTVLEPEEYTLHKHNKSKI